MKFFKSMKVKGEKMIKEAELLEAKALEMEKLLEEMPLANKNFILKLFPLTKWDEDFVNQRHKEFTKIVVEAKDATELFNTQLKNVIEASGELKKLVEAKVPLNLSLFNKHQVEEMKTIISQYEKDILARKMKEENEQKIASVYANAVKIADAEKIQDFEKFSTEKEASSFFKENYKDYTDVDVNGDSFGYKECYFYIDDVLVKVDFEYEIDKTNDMNDRDFYSAGDLSRFEFKMVDQKKLLENMEKQKQNEILALEAKLKSLKGA